MTKYWTLTEELYRSLHQWPKLILFCLVGFTLGWLISWIWPSPYRSTVNIYVGLNPYKAYDDKRFVAQTRPKYSNLDDYKNWQMSQLKSAIFLDEIIQETLVLLRQEDNYWETADSDQLRDMLQTDWRTAGRWSLVAEGYDVQRTTQVSLAWRQAVLERINRAVLAARSAFVTDEKLQAAVTEQVEAKSRHEDFLIAKESLQAWTEGVEGFPPDQSLGSAERWRVFYIASYLAQFTPTWTVLLEMQPSTDAPLQDYLDWVAQINIYIDGELPILRQKIDALDDEINRLEKQYGQEMDESLGLSPNLEIESLDQNLPEIVCPTGLMTLIGGFVGVCLWILLQLNDISRHE